MSYGLLIFVYAKGSGERPDIVIQDDSEVVGIEHCQVDVLFKIRKKKAQSMIGKQKNQFNKLVEKYKDEELLEKDISNGNALTSVLKLVEEKVDHKNSFNYSDFIGNFKRVWENIITTAGSIEKD